MASKDTHRKLTAILCADVVGYSRLMGADEEATIETLTAYREVFLSQIESNHGRIVDAKGDAILAEFASVVDAVNGAVEIQREFAEKNSDLSDDRRMDFRIGINLGDVVVQDDVIYGDGVNIAARLESLAEPGGICVSRSAYDQVKQKLKLHFEYMGEKQVKNIAEPVRAYQVLTKPGDAAHRVTEAKRKLAVKWRKVVLAVTAMIAIGAVGFLGWSYYQQRATEAALAAFEKEVDYPLPEKPSIAVLAFENLSGDPEQGYFADGLSENIITGLSRYYNLFVVARNSSFTYKGKAVDVRKVGRELGVRYVLEGSVQKTGARLRITAQLLDAATGRHLWAEKYDRELKDLFAVQDEITRRITGELLGELAEGEQNRNLMQRGTENEEAMTLWFSALDHLRRFNKIDTLQARKLAEEAIALDANFSYAYSLVAWSHVFPLMLGFSESPQEDFAKGEQLARQARQLDSSSSDAFNVLGYLSILKGEQENAIALFKKAISLNPNFAGAYSFLSLSQRYNGQPDKAIESMKTAMRLSPFYPAWYLAVLSGHYRHAGQYEKAISAIKAFKKREPKRWPHLLALIYAAMGRVEEARAEMKKALKIDPEISMKGVKRGGKLYRDPKTREKILAWARLAGIAE